MSEGITIKEFRMWLEGVEEMQADGWIPDARQWKRIREKLDTIKEIIPTISIQQPATVYRAPDILTPEQPTYTGPAVMAPPGLAVVRAAPPSNNALFGNGHNHDINNPLKTPNVDTSSGVYETAFL